MRPRFAQASTWSGVFFLGGLSASQNAGAAARIAIPIMVLNGVPGVALAQELDMG